MNRKFIDISSQHKLKTGQYIQWVKTVPAHNFKFISANNRMFAIIERTYYLDQSNNKIRYQTHNCDNASYDHSYTVFIEIYPGIFTYTGIATENGLTEKLERSSTLAHELSPKIVERFRKSLVRYGS